jgi:hypothetical protein
MHRPLRFQGSARCSPASCACLVTTMTVFLHLYEKKSGTREVDNEMERIVAALEQLNLIQRKATPITRAEIPQPH